MKIAILSINTGKYNLFFNEFYESSKKYFLPSHDRHWFVFSDECKQQNDDISYISIKNEEWPFCTLKRFHYFLQIEKELMKYDYVFFFNANTVFMRPVEDWIVNLNENQTMIAFKHIWLYGKHKKCVKRMLNFMSEPNHESQAFIEKRPYTYCYACAMGGKSEAFIEMSKAIKHMTEIDLSNRILPLWHDESYFNKYIAENPGIFKIYSEYNIYPEEMNKKQLTPILKGVASIKLLNKSKYFDVNKFKKTSEKSSDQIYINGNTGNMMFHLAHGLTVNPNVKSVCMANTGKLQALLNILKTFNLNLIVQTSATLNFDISNFQAEKHFDKDKTKQLFKFKKQYPEYFDYVGITIRRGDYIELNSIWYSSPMEYFEKAYHEYFEGKMCLISSNDIEYCKKNLKIPADKVVWADDLTDELLTKINMLSCCKNFIGSSSTFSWWCAWLNEENKEKIIFPHTWFKEKSNLTKDETEIQNEIVPDRWIKFDYRSTT